MTLTEQQKQFIWLAHGEQKSFASIEKLLNVSRPIISKWDIDLKNEWKPIAEIRAIYMQKKFKLDFKEFYDWFISKQENKKCIYCGITEPEIKIALTNKKIETKRGRGKKLELDRREPNTPYNDLNNIVYACYWCNQAKTDTFTHGEFLQIGKVIGNIWKKRGIE